MDSGEGERHGEGEGEEPKSSIMSRERITWMQATRNSCAHGGGLGLGLVEAWRRVCESTLEDMYLYRLDPTEPSHLTTKRLSPQPPLLSNPTTLFPAFHELPRKLMTGPLSSKRVIAAPRESIPTSAGPATLPIRKMRLHCSRSAIRLTVSVRGVQPSNFCIQCLTLR